MEGAFGTKEKILQVPCHPDPDKPGGDDAWTLFCLLIELIVPKDLMPGRPSDSNV